jgi:hypothetical protein
MKIIQAEGQTFNQVWIYSNYIADCLETGNRIFVLTPIPSMIDYPNFISYDKILFLFGYKFIGIKLGCIKYAVFLRYIFANKYSLKFLELFFTMIPLVKFICAKTGCTKSQYKIKYKSHILHIFTPSNYIQDIVNILFAKIREQYEIIIGVHIRLGDYKTFNDGKYYFSLEQYYEIMFRIKSFFQTKTVSFFIASNEPINISTFKGLQCFTIPQSSGTKDSYGLSCSDFIVGPPSTFSAWASYFGNIPIYFIEDLDNYITIDNFEVIQ